MEAAARRVGFYEFLRSTMRRAAPFSRITPMNAVLYAAAVIYNWIGDQLGRIPGYGSAANRVYRERAERLRAEETAGH